jgi:hypothetical protein
MSNNENYIISFTGYATQKASDVKSEASNKEQAKEVIIINSLKLECIYLGFTQK